MKKYWLTALFVTLVILLVSFPVLASGPGDPPGLEKAMAAQARHQEALFGVAGVEGVGVGFNESNQPAVIVFTEKPGVRGVPAFLDGVPVKAVVSGKFEALARPTGTKNTAPTVTITSPVNVETYLGPSITFVGSAKDKEDGVVNNPLTWTNNGGFFWEWQQFHRSVK